MKRSSFIFAAALAALVLGSCGSAAGDGSRVLLDVDEEAQMREEDVRGEDADPDKTGAGARDDEAADVTAQETAAEEPEPIFVHVCGAVANEGVYVLDAGSRVYEAVRAAGGFSEGADEAYVNQAQVLSDGMRLRIPTIEETTQAGGAQGPDDVLQATGSEAGTVPDVITAPETTDSGDKAEQPPGKIDINTADAQALCSLSGVGPATAAKIIAYREKNGRFTRIEDIMQVSGIKEKLFAKIKDSITV